MKKEYGRIDTLRDEIKRLRVLLTKSEQKVLFWKAKCDELGTPTRQMNNKMHDIRTIAKNPSKTPEEKLNLIVETTFK